MLAQIREAEFPDSPGVYVVYENAEDARPLYVGVAAKQTLRKRWMSNHLRPRAGGSSLRRSLGVHLGLVNAKLRSPDRYYPKGVEEQIGSFLHGCWIELTPTSDGTQAKALEAARIRALDPVLNVARPRI